MTYSFSLYCNRLFCTEEQAELLRPLGFQFQEEEGKLYINDGVQAPIFSFNSLEELEDFCGKLGPIVISFGRDNMPGWIEIYLRC